MKEVVVLGCGPAGLIAAHAAIQSGCKVQVLSEKKKSALYGAQYLHEYIPGLEEHRSGIIQYRYIGGESGYALKVYGDMSHPTSWMKKKSHMGYDLRQIYSILWDMYHHLMPVKKRFRKSLRLTARDS
jgi:Pyridine nucleotide-disulphide oxidoreductase